MSLRNLVSVAMVVAGGAIAAHAVDDETRQSSEQVANFYYFDGQRVVLDRSEVELVVRFSSTTALRSTPDSSQLETVFSLQTETGTFQVLSIVAPSPGQLARPGVSSAATLLADLRSRSDVEFAAPVYRSTQSGKRVMPTDELLVRLRPFDSLTTVASLFDQFGVEVDRPIRGTQDQFVLRLLDGRQSDPLAAANALFETGRFQWVEPNFVQESEKAAVPNDPLYSQQWHLRNTGQGGGTVGADAKVEQAWDIQQGSSSIVIAVIDDGVELAHEDLAANIFVNSGEIAGNGIDDDGNGYIDDVNGWDFSNNDNNPNPSHANDSHGTAVAGVAAARGGNGVGVSGACQTCRILPVKIFVNGSLVVNDLGASAIAYAASLSHVLVNSWTLGSQSNAVRDAIAAANATGRGGKGALVFFATGNSASGYELKSLPGFPAGTYTFQWEFYKGALDTASVGEDTARLAWIQFPGGEYVDFQAGAPAGWTSGGNALWTLETDAAKADEGICRTRYLQAGRITHNQISTVQVTKTVGAGTLFYYLWNSSEPTWDGTRLRVDGTDQNVTTTGVPAVNQAVSYPAAHPESIAVGASSDRDCRSAYSQFGPQLAFLAPSSGGPWNFGIGTTDQSRRTWLLFNRLHDTSVMEPILWHLFRHSAGGWSSGTDSVEKSEPD